MAYSPIEQGRLLTHPTLDEVARRRDASPTQIALAWLLRREGVGVIPRSGTPAHVEENAAARDIVLTSEDLESLEKAFPSPSRGRPLEFL